MKCEYCRRKLDIEWWECPGCGAPLPSFEKQNEEFKMRGRKFHGSGLGYTHYTDYIDLPGPFKGYWTDADGDVLRIVRD